MPEVRLCPKGYGAAGMQSKTEFEKILIHLGILQSGRASPLLLDGCDEVDA
jgi:hypothetical protein